MIKTIKEKLESQNERRLLKILRREVRKLHNLRIKLDKQDLIVSKLIEEHRKKYMYY